jgi:hypothetical protein
MNSVVKIERKNIDAIPSQEASLDISAEGMGWPDM